MLSPLESYQHKVGHESREIRGKVPLHLKIGLRLIDGNRKAQPYRKLRRLSSNGMSTGIRWILGIKMSSLVPGPLRIVASRTWGMMYFTVRRVSLHSLGGSKFLRSMTAVSTLRIKLCCGNPGGCN